MKRYYLLLICLFYYCTGFSQINSVEASEEESAYTIISTDTIYTLSEVPPVFPGGLEKLYKFIGKKVNFPKDAAKQHISGNVILSFYVDKSGQIHNIEVIKNLFPSLDAEAIRIVKQMPPWQPGTQKGKVVNSGYRLPIKFVSY